VIVAVLRAGRTEAVVLFRSGGARRPGSLLQIFDRLVVGSGIIRLLHVVQRLLNLLRCLSGSIPFVLKDTLRPSKARLRSGNQQDHGQCQGRECS
jgi:hypothetical protein